MNIAIFASAYHPSVGGVEELSRQLAREFRSRGWGVCVLTNRWPRNLPGHEWIEGIQVFRLPFRTPDAGWKSRVSYILSTGAVRRGVARILQQQNVDVIHVQCVGCNGHYATLAAKQLHVPLVVTLQGELTMDATKLFERSQFARNTLETALREAAQITACSQQTLAEVKHWNRAPVDFKSRVIRNGVCLRDFTGVIPFTHPRPYVLGMGRQVREKGFDLLIQAMAVVWKETEAGIDLILAGDGPQQQALKELSTRLGVEYRVIFAGRADRSKVAALLAGCEAFVLPSRHEPFGIVNLEAMACGKPVVATRVGGVPEIVVHGETGWLVEPDSPEWLAKGIIRVMNDPVLRSKLSDGGRSMAGKHDWSLLGDQYEDVYRIAIGSRSN